MNKSDLRAHVDAFLDSWNRTEWMVTHGDWDSDDEIEEGTIDPDGVEEEAQDLDVGKSWSGWDCREGWRAYQVGEALYVNWWRIPYPNTNRKERDLWVCVDANFFEVEVES